MKKSLLFFVMVFAVAAAGALPNPAALFTFDTDTRQVVNAVSGSAYPIPQSVEIKSGGVSGSYLALARKDDAYVSLGRAFAFEGDYTISFWMRTAPGYRETASMLLSRHSAGSYNGIWFMVNAEWGYGQQDKLTFYYSNAAVISRTSVNDGRWHHVGLVHRKSGVELFIDGRSEARGGPINETVPNVDFVLGALTWERPHGNFAGDLDEVALFGEALSESEVAGLSAAPAYFAKWKPGSSGIATGGTATNFGDVSKAGDAVMRVTLQNGQVIAIPISDIVKIEFGGKGK